MKNSILLFLTISSLILVSCDDDSRFCINGQGPTITRTLSLSDFSGIELSIDAKIIISQGNDQAVMVTGQSNIIDELETRVTSNIWDIDFDRNCAKNYNLTINITIPNLSQVEITGSGTITIKDFTNQTDLDIDISGSGEVFLNEFDGLSTLIAEITGSGLITAEKEITSVDLLEIVISGSGDFQGFSIFSSECNVRITGSGSCEVRASDKIDVVITGSGDVFYKGNPLINQSITGSGNLRDAN